MARAAGQVRAGFAADSAKAAVLAPGAVVEVLEAATNEAGALRIRFAGGWVNVCTANSVVCLQPADAPELAAAAAAGPPAAAPAPSGSEAEAAAAPAAVEREAAPAPAPRAKGKVVVVDYRTPDLVRSSWMWLAVGRQWSEVRTAPPSARPA